MKNSKMLIAVVIALIVFNCVLLGLFWFRAYQKPQQQTPPIQGSAFEYLTQQLQLTPAQQQQYTTMRIAHRETVEGLNQQSRMMRDSFFAKLKDTTASKQTIEALSKRIAANTQQIDTSTFFHFQRFRKILTPKQQQRFDEIIEDVLRMGGIPRPAGQGGPPPPQGQFNRQRIPPNGPPPAGVRGGRPRQGLPPFGPPRDGQRPGQRMNPPDSNNARRGMPPPYGRGPRPGMPPPPPGQGPPPNGGPPPYGPPPGGPPPGGGPPQK